MQAPQFDGDTLTLDLRGHADDGMVLLEQAEGDPRWADVSVVRIRGATDDHARWAGGAAAYTDRKRSFFLTEGTITDEGARHLTYNVTGSVHDNQISRAGLKRLSGADPGCQRLPPGVEPVQPSHFQGPAEPLDALVEAWAQRLVDGVIEMLGMAKEARTAAPLKKVKPSAMVDRRWMPIVGERQVLTRVPGWAAALQTTELRGKPNPVREGAARAVRVAATALEACTHRFDDDDAYGDWGPTLALAIAQVMGMIEEHHEWHVLRITRKHVPPLVPQLERYEQLRQEILERQS